MITSGLYIFDDRLLKYEQLLSTWIKCTHDYVEISKGADLPYWYNERANVGILAGAAWQSGLVALEEFQAEKIANDNDELQIPKVNEDKGKAYLGRNDLYIASESIAAYIEAKVAFPNISAMYKEKKHIEDKLKLAISDVEKVKAEDESYDKIAVLFVAPYSKTNKASDKSIKDFIDTISTYAREDKLIGALAWCSPKHSQETPSHNDRYYPIVAVLFCKT